MTTPDLLVPASKAMLLGSFGYSLLRTVQGRQELALPFERLVVGMLALALFQPAARVLAEISAQLVELIRLSGAAQDLRALVLDAFKQSLGPKGSDLPGLLEQAWRTGVWGMMSAVVEGFFLIVGFVLECAHEVLWALLLMLVPLACGVFPIFPRLLSNLVLYAVELCLWFPLLVLIERVGGEVASRRLTQEGSWGLYLVGVETVAILLICLIPTVAHRFLSGAFSGDFGSQQSVFVLVQKVVRARPPVRSGGAS